MFNTIILVHGDGNCPERKWLTKVQPGDSIFGTDSDAKEIKRWPIDKKDEALAALAKHRCKYTLHHGTMWIDEYALEYCECDEDGDFIMGSDYDLAPTKED